MATMEHVCTQCDYAVFNNTPRMHSCPKCGAPMQSFWDEEDDYRIEKEEANGRRRANRGDDW